MKNSRYLAAIILGISYGVSLAVAEERATRWRFDFGPGDVASGFTRIVATSIYSEEWPMGRVRERRRGWDRWNTPGLHPAVPFDRGQVRGARASGGEPDDPSLLGPRRRHAYFSTVSGRFGVVPVTTQPALALGNLSELPRRFSSLAPWAPRGSEITPDGRFVGRTPAGEAIESTGAVRSQEIYIVLNWVEELKRLVPVK
mgnify:CR=1 FL=1